MGRRRRVSPPLHSNTPRIYRRFSALFLAVGSLIERPKSLISAFEFPVIFSGIFALSHGFDCGIWQLQARKTGQNRKNSLFLVVRHRDPFAPDCQHSQPTP